MISGKSVLAIIPARQGSKRCPDKNITLYKNKSTGEILPLIAWAIKHATGSKYIDTIAIASDSPHILNYAIPPIRRILLPAHIANGTSEATIAFCLYSCTQLGEPSLPFHDLFVLLQPTSPNRLPQDIDAALQLTAKTGHRTITTRSDTNQRNGAVYCSPSSTFLSDLSLSRAQPIPMPPHRSLDIDSPSDFNL